MTSTTAQIINDHLIQSTEEVDTYLLNLTYNYVSTLLEGSEMRATVTTKDTLTL